MPFSISFTSFTRALGLYHERTISRFGAKSTSGIYRSEIQEKIPLKSGLVLVLYRNLFSFAPVKDQGQKI